jgi:hypothetical protein
VLRNEIRDLTPDKQLKKISEFCATMPVGRRTVDYYSPADWATPWEILFHGEFCKSSISLLIFYTIMLVNKDQNIELWLVKGNDSDYLLPVVDNQYILNYEAGKINNYSDICDYFIVMQKYSKDQIKKLN